MIGAAIICGAVITLIVKVIWTIEYKKWEDVMKDEDIM